VKRLLMWIGALVFLSVVAHEITIVFTPRILMGWIIKHLEAPAGIDAIVHAPRADEHQRLVVMPSPDLLYSYCVYDLAKGPMQVHAEIPQDTMWSVSAFDSDTNNFYALNDREAAGSSIDLLLVSDSMPASLQPEGLQIVRSPSKRGLLLFRTLVDNDLRVAQLDAVRRRANCRALPSFATENYR